MKASIQWKNLPQTPWQYYEDDRSSINVRIILDTDCTGFFAWLTPDAYVAPSRDVIDSGPGPLDADAPLKPKAVEEAPDGEKDMETYLLAVFMQRGGVMCLWLRPTGRRENEFQRIGFIKLAVFGKFDRPSQTVILV